MDTKTLILDSPAQIWPRGHPICILFDTSKFKRVIKFDNMSSNTVSNNKPTNYLLIIPKFKCY